MTYRFEDYNEDNVLKVPFMLSLSCFYLSKYLFFLILLPIIGVIPRLSKGIDSILPQVQIFAHQPLHILFLFSSIPAFVVLITLVKRSRHTEAQIFRQIWSYGYVLLWLSVGIEMGLIITSLVTGIDRLNEWWIGFMYLDVMIALYLFKSQRIKDMFKEFPTYQPRR